MKNLALILLFVISGYASAQTFDKPFHLPFQDPNYDYSGRWQLVTASNLLFVFYTSGPLFDGSIYYRTSSNEGSSWSSEHFIIKPAAGGSYINLASTVTNSGRIILVYSVRKSLAPFEPTKVIYSDNNGLSWSSPANIVGTNLYIEYPNMTKTPDNKIIISGGTTNYFFMSTDEGVTWTPKQAGFRMNALTAVDQNIFISFILQNDNIFFRKSTDAGTTWSSSELLRDDNYVINNLTVINNLDGSIALLYYLLNSTKFPYITQSDLRLITSSDSGTVWSPPIEVTRYKGSDTQGNLYLYNNEVYVNFLSYRTGRNQAYLFKTGITQDTNTPPAIVSTHYELRNVKLFLSIHVDGEQDVASVNVHSHTDINPYDSTNMFDDGLHEDSAAGDDIWAVELGSFVPGSYIYWYFSGKDISNNYFRNREYFIAVVPPEKFSRMSSGSLHNWYSSFGSEREQGFIARQQYGLNYPSAYPYQDMQAAKGFWMGVKNFTDEYGILWQNKVVHSGPKVTGESEFFPVRLITKARFEQPQVIVNGNTTPIDFIVDTLDPGMQADREIYNELNTLLGITVKRRIFQFSHPLHDNYIVNEYTFVNTGNTDWDDSIEIAGNNITGLQLFYLYRWAVCAQTRYVIHNATGWGINTMLDARGDGVKPNPPGEDFRTIFGWHGYWPLKQVSYNNIGGPIWTVPGIGGFVPPDDTIGRLGAVQFPGVLTLHADVSALNNSDDPLQPKSTLFVDSDNILLSNNSPYDTTRMRMEYELMSRGHDNPRHAWAVEPSGNFAIQTNPPDMGTPGGFSAANGYGPYNVAFGDSIRIIWVEGAASISREEAVSTGKLYKQGLINDLTKNTIVLTGKDSLMKTWQKAIENFNSGYNIPQAPLPPKKVIVDSLSDRIELQWEAFPNSNAVMYRVYRSMNIADSTFRLVYECPATTFSYKDLNLINNRYYNYYVCSVNSEGIESNKTYTLALTGFNILTGLGDDNVVPGEFTLMQNYPNPFNPLTKIKFTISEGAYTSLKVYDILGNEAAVLIDKELETGDHEVSFNGKNLASGVYIYRLQSGSYSQNKKMILLR